MAGGDAVGSDQIAEFLWPRVAPARPQTAVQVHISALRKILGRELIETVGNGYRLAAAREIVDVFAFEALLSEGRDLSDRRMYPLARDRLVSALRLWRGPPLQEFSYDAWAQGDIRRLEELRAGAFEELTDVRLQLNEHSGLISELEEFVGVNPTRERGHGQLMLALYRSGRQSEALDAYHHLREQLDADVGLDPSPALQTLYKQILNQESTLTLEAATPRPPTNLPTPANALVGRDAALGEVIALVGEQRGRILTLTGPGGIGKTRLAIEAAAKLRDDFPDGVYYVPLAAVRDPRIVVSAILEQLGLHPQSGDSEDQALLRGVAGGKLLLVLDNLEQVV
jgi:DNA-binding SARP family transcriptional activator